MRKALFAAIAAVCAAGVFGEEVSGDVRSARSVHLWYVSPTREKATGVQATVTVRDTVPGTYFCAACFNMGYCGFQELFDGSRVFIFSVWDPGDPFDFSANPDAVKEERRVKCLFSKNGVRVKRFGGEGTGGQAMAPFAVTKGVFSAEKSPSRAISAEPAPGGWTLATGGDTPDRTSLLDKPMAAVPRGSEN